MSPGGDPVSEVEVPLPALSPNETAALAEYEVVIERGMGVFVEVGAALMAVRDDQPPVPGRVRHVRGLLRGTLVAVQDARQPLDSVRRGSRVDLDTHGCHGRGRAVAASHRAAGSRELAAPTT